MDREDVLHPKGGVSGMICAYFKTFLHLRGGMNAGRWIIEWPICFNYWDTASDYTVPLRTLYSEYSKT